MVGPMRIALALMGVGMCGCLAQPPEPEAPMDAGMMQW
jgi:hypothetical protein